MRVGKVRVAVLAAVVVVFIGTISAAPAAVGPSPEAGEGGPMDGLDAGSNPVVPTDAGPVRGTTHADHRSFQAIPYAAPPVGDLRWRSPRRPVPWVEPRDATKPGAACPQVAIAVAEVGSREEDCLSLNVFVPRSAVPGSLHPVMVWIHGGGGANGAGSFFDPRRLTVDGDVVVVTVNYRLGIFGAFGLAGLEGSGGFGLEDQQAALRWVQRNIAAFGGDPENVTLFGESYGALATSAHLTSPAAAGLFHRAAIQSGLALIDFPPNTLLPGQPALPSMWLPPPEIEELGAFVATELGCTDGGNALACLRALPVEDLLLHSSLFTRYAFGSDVLPEDPVAALRAGRFHPVPLISGATRDEARLFVATFYDLAGQAVTPEGYPALLAEAFGPAAERVAARYPLAAYESPSLAWAAVITDRVWALRTMEQNRSLADHVPTYAYEFADQSAPPIVPFPPGFPPGAYHSAEVAYQFDLESGGAPFSPEQRSLAEQMNRYWARFAATGDPNGDDLPRWERFDNAASVPHVQALAPGRDGIRPVDYASRHQLDFWAGLD